jgi:hypothetical protein
VSGAWAHQPKWDLRDPGMLHAGDAYFFHEEMSATPRCTPGLAIFQRLAATSEPDHEKRGRRAARVGMLWHQEGDDQNEATRPILAGEHVAQEQRRLVAGWLRLNSLAQPEIVAA